MLVLSIFGLVLTVILLLAMLAQARPWKKAKLQGKVLKTVSLNFWQRLQYYRFILLALVIGILFGLAAGWMPALMAVFAAGFALSILFFPMQYTFTTQGVGVGQGIFRAWNEFTGITRKNGRLVLQASTFGALTLYAKPVELDNVLNRISHIRKF